MTFEERINPKQYNFSPKLVAIVGAIIGYDYGVRDRKGGLLSNLSITSDGYLMSQSTANDIGAFVGSISEVEDNLEFYKEELSPDDRAQFESLYKSRVIDWR